jgi:hypothetical protein
MSLPARLKQKAVKKNHFFNGFSVKDQANLANNVTIGSQRKEKGS